MCLYATPSLELHLQTTVWSMELSVSTKLTGALTFELGNGNEEHPPSQSGTSSQAAAVHLHLRVGDGHL